MNPIVGFVGVAYALMGALSVVVWATGGYRSPFAGLGFVAMLLPSLAVFIVRFGARKGPRIDWSRLPASYVPVAVLLMPVILHAIVLARLALAGPLPWQDWLTPDANGLYHSPVSRGWGVLTTTELIAHVVVNGGVGLVMNSVLALFEEIGWRGWLLPLLAERMSARLAVVVSATIWALWHIPLGLSGLQHIDGVSPIHLAMGIPVGVAATGLIIGWLWIRTKSIWIVAIAHGALNDWGQYALKYMRDFTVPDPTVVLSYGFLGLYVVGILLLMFGIPPSPRGQKLAAA
jgi:membrane protease YdiL (CAAX protease family)